MDAAAHDIRKPKFKRTLTSEQVKHALASRILQGRERAKLRSKVKSNTNPRVECLARPGGFLVRVVLDGGTAVWQRKCHADHVLQTLDAAALARRRQLHHEEITRGLPRGTLQ